MQPFKLKLNKVYTYAVRNKKHKKYTQINTLWPSPHYLRQIYATA